MNSSSATSLLLGDIIQSPTKAESILESLTAEQILMIESTIDRVKQRKLDKSRPKETNHAIANALAAAMVSAALQQQQQQQKPLLSPKKEPQQHHDPVAEIKNGIEWVSFVYSHNRTLKRYSIRTDIQNVILDDEKFKAENCVYPRANLPKETYKGNRWAYETECNDLGWKLAWLNKEEIAGKRGLIQRAVDSYRNRYPNMRSRRVARQEKLLNGTLRKRKNREEEERMPFHPPTAVQHQRLPQSLEAAIVKPSHQPKTIAIDDLMSHTRYRIKIHIESVQLDEIPQDFRQQNSPFPRAYLADPDLYMGGRERWVQDTILNELSWKLAYLNPRILAGKKNLLQRALDVYRSKFMPSLQPRKSCRSAPHFDKKKRVKKSNPLPPSPPPPPPPTPYELADCFSLDDEDNTVDQTIRQDPMISPSYDDSLFDTRLSPFDDSCNTSSSSVACTPSPPVSADIFGFADVYDTFMLPPVNETFLLLDNDTNMGIKCYDPPNSPSNAILLDPLF
ncbi:hypothetical protein BY458DRAFT_432868 [Sporodiniella umbellata]|nr:hypothetical protein BY458DRAFT_432868 [Sporodiniella umbellata]